MISNIHRGQYLQRGRGLGGIFSTLIKFLKPVLSKGTSTAVKLGKYVSKDPDINHAVSSIKSAAIKSGTKKIVNRLNQQNKAVKRAKKELLRNIRMLKKEKQIYFHKIVFKLKTYAKNIYII